MALSSLPACPNRSLEPPGLPNWLLEPSLALPKWFPGQPPGESKLVLQPPQSSEWLSGASRAVQMESSGLSKWLSRAARAVQMVPWSPRAARMAPNLFLDVSTAGCGFTSCLDNFVVVRADCKQIWGLSLLVPVLATTSRSFSWPPN